MTHVGRLLTIGWLASTLAGPAPADDPPPPAPASPKAEAPPITIFLNAPSDRDAFWKILGRPDLVVLDGDRYRRLVEAARPPAPGRASPVESVAATGEVEGDWARMTVAIRATLADDGPAWVAIGLDGLPLTEVKEGTRPLPTRATEGRSWEVELAGRGEHPVVVTLMVPVRSTAEGRRLDLPVPLAASTRIELTVPRKVADAGTGINEPVPVLPADGGNGTRLMARLSPRARIELSWRERADPSVTLPALLSVQGEIALEVERGAIRARSSWLVGAIRGTASELTLRLDPAEEVLDIEVDRRASMFEARKDGARSLVVVPLAEPLRPNQPKVVVINTRRPIASSGIARVAIQGYVFDQARAQTGFLAIGRSGPIFLNPTPGRGLRRVDPRTELPDGFLTRADTSLAFEFNDQPFELSLAVEPAPPRLLVENRTTVRLDPRSARVNVRLDCRALQGRTFELAVLMPEGLEFEGAGPPEVVAAARAIPLNARSAAGDGPEVARSLTITLTLPARESGAFTVQLRGRCAVDASKAVAIPLFQPLADPSTGGRYVVVTERNVAAEPVDVGEEPSAFRVDWEPPPTDWPWPDRRPGPETGQLWLRSEAKPETLPLRVTVRPRSIRHEATLAATVDRSGAEVVDEVAAEVAFGSTSRVDVAVPPEVPSRWEVEGIELAAREPIGQDPDGTRRYRLRFARDHAEAFRLRFRYRLPFAEALGPGREGRLRLNPIRLLEGTSTGQALRVSAPAGIEVDAEAKGWSPTAPPDPSAAAEPGPTVRVAYARPDDRSAPVAIRARLGPRLAVPSPVVSRLWLRTVQRPEGDLATTASFWVESRDGPMTLGLPPGSRWVRARIAGREATEGDVEPAGPDAYRVRFPASTPSGAVLVGVDYEIPAPATRGPWAPPRLLGGGVVQQTAWEVRLPGNRAGIGTPTGWTDENEWHWDGLLWRRRPWKGPAELSRWLDGGSPRYRADGPIDPVEPAGRHGYLFSRSGPPVELRFEVYSRFVLVLLGSGPVLACGLLVLARRPPPRAVGGVLLGLAAAALAFLGPDTTIPLLQAAAPGVLLLLGALAMNRFLDRRGPARTSSGRAPVVGQVVLGSSVAAMTGVGSDDSTAIRPRPAVVSTADHVALTRDRDEPPTPDRDFR